MSLARSFAWAGMCVCVFVTLCFVPACGWVSGGPRPALSRTAVRMSTDYDYIVVGGGAGGSTLAKRLGDAGKSVLLLEAGGPPSSLNIKIPAGILKLFKSQFDWDFTSENEPALNGRGIYLCRGKVLGGSTCTNVMLYHRGTANDYNEYWPQGWGSKDVLPYFTKSEDFYAGASTYHGAGGLLHVDNVKYDNILSKSFLEACRQLRFRDNKDFNDWSHSQEGVGKFNVVQKRGRRQDAYTSFLKRKTPSSLQVLSQALATKVIFDGKQASGVQYEQNNKVSTAMLKNGGEVLVCGGAIHSPQLLLLSGIGSKEQLSPLGIDVISDLPGVGKNLQDHPAAVVAFNTKDPISITDDLFVKGTGFIKPRRLLQWFALGRGPLTSVGCEYGGFFRTSHAGTDPDLQVRFVAGRGLTADGVAAYKQIGERGMTQSGATFQCVSVRAHSRGEVKLRTADPTVKPIITTNYLTDERDRATIREGLRLARTIASVPALANYLADEVFPGVSVRSDSELDEYLRNTVHSANALVGTCKMGSGPDSVVDSELKVRGVEGLRVVCSSVIPRIPGGQTGAPTFMVAERAADLILGKSSVGSAASGQQLEARAFA